MGTSVLSNDRVKSRPMPIPTNRLCIKTRGRFVFVELNSILWFESAGNYVHIRVAGQPVEEYVVRSTLQSFEDQLDETIFVRIHRSIIVNCRKIRELRPCFTGEYIVTLDNGNELTLSRKYRANLQLLIRMSSQV
jgi:two-component system LytT family response regulator